MEFFIRVLAIILTVTVLLALLFKSNDFSGVDHGDIDHLAFTDSLEQISKQLSGLVSTLKKVSKDKKRQYPAFCKDIQPTNSSGEYLIKPDTKKRPFKAFCTLNTRCGDSEDFWMRVAHLDMSDPSQQCPKGFKLITRSSSPRRTCGRPGMSGCQSVVFPVHGVQYSKVCGQVKAYQFGSPDAFFRYDNSLYLDSHYVDGVSITHGRAPCTHIWTFVAAYTTTNRNYGCPCAMSDYQGTVPPFIGEYYFCESGQRSKWSLLELVLESRSIQKTT